jgi:DNA repair protein RecO (recombination protein O)
MGKTHRLTGINLKSMPLGEADRILTILSPEVGLIRVSAPGARKANAKLGGRSGLFVVNDLIVAQGKTLDRITQAETIESYPGLARDLAKLTAGQYLAEIALHQALTDQPQPDLYYLLTEHLRRIAQAERDAVLPALVHAIYQLLALAGLAPQVQQCSISGEVLEADLVAEATIDADWQVGFSIEGGGVISLTALSHQLDQLETSRQAWQAGTIETDDFALVREAVGEYRMTTIAQLSRQQYHRHSEKSAPHTMLLIDAIELYLMQQLAQETLTQLSDNTGFVIETIEAAWRQIEQILRQYTQYHFGRKIRSAALVDQCFAPLAVPLPVLSSAATVSPNAQRQVRQIPVPEVPQGRPEVQSPIAGRTAG